MLMTAISMDGNTGSLTQRIELIPTSSGEHVLIFRNAVSTGFGRLEVPTSARQCPRTGQRPRASVALLRWAGSMRPGSNEPLGRRLLKPAFGVPVLQGPIEDQEHPTGYSRCHRRDDVIEHLPDPVFAIDRASNC